MIFSLKILKNYIARCDFGAVDILSTGSLIFYTGLITDNAECSLTKMFFKTFFEHLQKLLSYTHHRN